MIRSPLYSEQAQAIVAQLAHAARGSAVGPATVLVATARLSRLLDYLKIYEEIGDDQVDAANEEWRAAEDQAEARANAAAAGKLFELAFHRSGGIHGGDGGHAA